MIGKVIEYLSTHKLEYLTAIKIHLTLSIEALLLATVIAVPLGIICYRNKKLAKYITGCFNTLRIIPSLAILVLMIPLMGTGMLPALVALTILAIPPVLINTTAGFLSIEPSLYEVAKGMGMDKSQIFFKVEVPLSLPLILTGIRTAAVEATASATLAAYIGAGGLGNIVFTGLGLNRTELLLVGGISVAAISILVEVLLSILQSSITRYQID